MIVDTNSHVQLVRFEVVIDFKSYTNSMRFIWDDIKSGKENDIVEVEWRGARICNKKQSRDTDTRGLSCEN